jgi:AraC-like DNA-binding protein
MPKTASQFQYWSRAGSLVGMQDVAVELGQELAPMLTRFGFPVDVLADPEKLISYNALCKLLEACAKEWACPHFGLRVAKVRHINVLGPIGLVARLSNTVGDAFRALIDHIRLHSTGYDLHIDMAGSVSGGSAALILLPRPHGDTGPQLHLLVMGVARNIIVQITGNKRFRPRSVHFTHAVQIDPTEVRRYFGCPVEFGAERTMLIFDAAMLGQPTAIHDAAYEAVIRPYLNQMNAEFTDDVLESTRRLIGQLLSTRRCSRNVIAEYMNLHPRTLQRRLLEQGTSFSKLIDEHRHAVALDLVSRKVMPLAQIADALGYSNQSVFNQAFRRWTGTSPKRIGASPAIR